MKKKKTEERKKKPAWRKAPVIKSVCDCRICDTYENEGIVRCRNCGRKRD